MKLIKNILCLILSLLLALSILLSTCVYGINEVLKKEKLQEVLKSSSIGENLLGYEYLDEDVEEEDFLTAFYNYIPVQPILFLNISLDKADTCHNAAFEYVKDKIDSNHAYTNLDKLAEDLSTGYYEAAVNNKYINPNEYISYTDILNNRVRKPKGEFLKETMNTKFTNILQELIDEEYICCLDIDQETPFSYLLRTGKSSNTIRNGLYKHMEDTVNNICATQVSNFIDSLIQNNNSYKALEKNEVLNLVIDSINEYLDQNNITRDKIEDNYAFKKIESSNNSFIYPKINSFLPSYQETLNQLNQEDLTILKLLTNNTLLYVGIGVSILLGIIILAINKFKGLPFIGFSCILSGAILFLSKIFVPGVLDKYLTDLSYLGDALAMIIPNCILALIDMISKFGIYAFVAGIIISIISIPFTRKS